jgi:hypothetical protein
VSPFIIALSLILLTPSGVALAQMPNEAPTPSGRPGVSVPLGERGAGQQSAAGSDPMAAAAKALSLSATALEKASVALSTAAEKLPVKEDEKVVADGRLGIGQRTNWNGALLLFKEKEKKVTGRISVPWDAGSWLFTASLTAPLDKETRIAALVDSRTRFSPFEAKISLEHNFIADSLRIWMKGQAWSIDECEEFRAYWVDQQKDKPEGSRERTPACPTSNAYLAWERKRGEQNAATGPIDGLSEKPVPRGIAWTLGLDAAFGFDRQDVYIQDLSTDTFSKTASSLTVLAVARFYPASWLAVPIRIGGGYEDSFEVYKTKRCRSMPSTDSLISGQSCDDALFLKEDLRTVGTGTLEGALVAIVPGLATMAPGVELRERLDISGSVVVNKLSIAAFASPTATPVLTRFGIGLELNYALSQDSGDDPDFDKGDRWLVPFLLAGGSL